VEFEFDQDQLLHRQSVRETLAKTGALPADELWATYTALGWLEAPPVELAIVLDELGYVADPAPVTSAGPAGVDLAAGIPDLALMGLAVTTVGAYRRILDLVVAHVKQRHQFGVPIGSFQAVKHKAADMYLAIERARVLAYYSALTIAEDDPRRHRAAVMAKAAAGECQEVVYRNGTQLFGAMGFTWENDLHLYLKRAVAANLLLGSATVQRKALLEMEVVL
jgi:alkylation response protein AidB-like acyl-CoA dehydrogenase